MEDDTGRSIAGDGNTSGEGHLFSAENMALSLARDKCALLLSGEMPRDAKQELADWLTEELARMGGKNEAIVKQAQRVLEARFAESDGDDVFPTVVFDNEVLLTGTPPTEPEDAKLEWAEDFFSGGFEVDAESDTVDYRERKTHLSVSAGQLLATVYPARSGAPGVDVFGKPLPPRKPRTVRLRAANNVRLDEAEGCYYATADGRLRYANGVLAVDSVFMITESVNLETGNVRHPGAVVVGQNIEAESKVEAAGDIEVNGYIENAEVIAGGNLLVKGGITCGGGGFIRVAGEVRAKFIQNADVRAHGSVVVEREIDQSEVLSRGAIVVTRGRIVGGKVVALQGVAADQTGSDAGIQTSITTGEDFELDEKVGALEAKRDEHRRMKEQIDSKLEPFSRITRIPDNVRVALATLREQSAELQKRADEAQQEIDALRAEFAAQRKLEIVIRKYVAPDCSFHVSGLTLRSQDSFPGPVKVGIKDGEIHYMETKLKR